MNTKWQGKIKLKKDFKRGLFVTTLKKYLNEADVDLKEFNWLSKG